MANSNPKNERIKRDYFSWMKQAHGRSDGHIDAAAQALAKFESYTRHRDFKKFHIQQAVGFKEYLQNVESGRTGQRLSLATVSAILAQVRAFFLWLADRPGFKRVLTHADAAYFNLTTRDERISTVSDPRQRPSMEQLLHILAAMPSDTVIERRDRAVFAFAMCTGAPDGTFPGLRLKHVDLDGRVVHFDPRQIHTKFGKDFNTWFFPVPTFAETIVRAWIEELRAERQFGPDDPAFPQTLVVLNDEHRFEAATISREPWKTASAVRDIFKRACTRVGLPYFAPHGVRHALTTLGMKVCNTPEEMKAWSQNLGHDHVMTTLNSYGKVLPERQAILIEAMRVRDNQKAAGGDDTAATLRQVRELLGELEAKHVR